MMILMPSMANAQIVKKSGTKIQTILETRMGHMGLYLSNGVYLFSMGTTNQFDDSMLINLGDDLESASQTMQDLIDLVDEMQKNEIVSIDNGLGKEISISKVGKSGLIFIADGYAGTANTSKGELQKFLKALQK